LTLYQVDAVVITALGGIIALLWSRWPVPLAWLKALELGMIGLLAGRVAFVQYRMMLVYSLRDDPMMAQLTMKNIVLLTSILILGSTFGARTMSRLRRQVAEARQLGQYHLKRRLGAGGMGEVYLAEHQLLKRPCALKLIRAGEATDPRALERFEREVRLTAT